MKVRKRHVPRPAFQAHFEYVMIDFHINSIIHLKLIQMNSQSFLKFKLSFFLSNSTNYILMLENLEPGSFCEGKPNQFFSHLFKRNNRNPRVKVRKKN